MQYSPRDDGWETSRVMNHEAQILSERPKRPGMATAGIAVASSQAWGPAKYSRWEAFNAIRYVLHTGRFWRMLPHDLPPNGGPCSATSAPGGGMGNGSGSMRLCVTGCVLPKAETSLLVRRS